MAYPGSSSTACRKITLQATQSPVVQAYVGERRRILHRALVVTAPLVWPLLGFVERLEGGSHPSTGKHRMGVRRSVVGGREAWIVPQCFLEALNALAYALFRTPVPEMAGPEDTTRTPAS